MTTETQDIRMPVEYVCPHCGKLTHQEQALKVEAQARKSRGEKLDGHLQPADCTRVKCEHKECGRAFATRWANDALKSELGVGRETSEKFDIGRNFCNKLWNAARFSFMNLENTPCAKLNMKDLLPEDRWILARLSQTVRRYHECLRHYQFSASVKELREFFWDSLCDWYIELTKPRLAGAQGSASAKNDKQRESLPYPEPQASACANAQGEMTSQPSTRAGSSQAPSASRNDGDIARQILAFCLDQTLRLFHPTIPFITERLWQQLNTVVSERGFPGIAELETDSPLILAAFPPDAGYPAFDDEAVLQTFAELQAATRGVRDLRVQCNVSPKEKVTVTVVVPEPHLDSFKTHAHIVRHMANISELHVTANADRPRNAGYMAIRSLRIYVHDVSDDQAERDRTNKALQGLEKQITGKQAKLGNKKFLTHARPEVVQAEQERLAELMTRQASLRQHLTELDG
ncbi:MAG: class I tRNA ligase family protein [Planctomycetes bacterium]|nr:class I tRNA ligase family protein [Planctomycetota bacterium]